jgi:hypothetical protein
MHYPGDESMPWHLAALLILAALVAAPTSAEEEPDPCEGRNPLHCRNPVAATPEPDGKQPAADAEGTPAPDPEQPAAQAEVTPEPEPGQPAADVEDCEGKNPLYCGVPAISHGEGGVVLMPPGGCEGRNPLYCRERAPEVEAEPEEEPRRQRANSSSANPRRNPKKNPRSNPNRRSRGGGGS